MSKSDEIEFIGHIFEELKFVINTTNSLTYELFIEDEVIKRAVVRALEIVGEATKNLSIDFRLKYNQVPWKFMAGMRDKLIHDYMGVDYRLVFKTAKEDVPELFDFIELIIKEHTNK
ncbi:DUF86 domain-containing protein [Flavobacterium azooxidireducens]|uniref:DUF86 domain-containing protein n=1 Tax=Flavobacterium azooxidireducens TaxID=1871076 RepID=A0ABY4KK96_9FLAO|nr:DUF86 domain-containing protein [Flavobacterium azooxidireducens]UPQ80820.1 DUF86 domain-containing protein [Flavobacterium azooxidireducens]